jgi:hypothetical protein
MDILISSTDERVISHLEYRQARRIDTSGILWGLRIESLEELVADLAENAPTADGWMAQILDFKRIN